MPRPPTRHRLEARGVSRTTETVDGTPETTDMRLPTIDGLRAFEALARLGSLERAGEALAVTASAVGKRLNALEDLLGTPLFSRGPRGLALTVVGKEYLAQVRTALGLLAAMPQHQRQVQRLQRLRVCAPPTFARQILVPALPDFGARHPDVELEVVLSTPYLDSNTPDADVEIVHGKPGTEVGLLLMRDVVVPLVAPALMRRQGLHFDIDARGRARPAARPAPTDWQHWPLLRTPVEPWTPWLQAADLNWPEPSSGPRLVDLGLTLEAAAGAQGVALARPSLARSWLRTGALWPLSNLCIEPATHYLVRHAPGHDTAQAFAAWMAEICSAAAAEGLALISDLR